MSELKKHFKRLLEFAKQNNFRQPFSQVYFTEDKSIRRNFDSAPPEEISRTEIFTFEDYENRFDEILNQGYAWINLSLEGLLNGALLISVGFPEEKKNVPFEAVSINLSLPETKVVEDDWNAQSFYKITE